LVLDFDLQLGDLAGVVPFGFAEISLVLHGKRDPVFADNQGQHFRRLFPQKLGTKIS
jgi:hypothetical protein